MAEFMVHATFHQQDQQHILARIPQEREHIKLLIEQGVVEALYIASDFSGVWIVARGVSSERATPPGVASFVSLHDATMVATLKHVVRTRDYWECHLSWQLTHEDLLVLQ